LRNRQTVADLPCPFRLRIGTIADLFATNARRELIRPAQAVFEQHAPLQQRGRSFTFAAKCLLEFSDAPGEN
jgi:hypothetical protein